MQVVAVVVNWDGSSVCAREFAVESILWGHLPRRYWHRQITLAPTRTLSLTQP